MPMFIERAAAELGLKVISPYELKIDENTTIHFDVYLPQLGGVKGMLVSVEYNKELFDQIGPEYGYSCFDVRNESDDGDVEGYKEVFLDWGWNSTESEKPDWML